ncbi:hypothetical protein CDL12_10728 [Handroanthus impetiginosus]|uniref:Uncharacterized protein n=1 Tax=Handroanthus impetiginosus TaxID=429701 RepID=A0A2G9HGF9_9LAMI|nr:hypothetical protein CDL12_10728 [Handroanthus impetiginosus]
MNEKSPQHCRRALDVQTISSNPVLISNYLNIKIILCTKSLYKLLSVCSLVFFSVHTSQFRGRRVCTY